MNSPYHALKYQHHHLHGLEGAARSGRSFSGQQGQKRLIISSKAECEKCFLCAGPRTWPCITSGGLSGPTGD